MDKSNIRTVIHYTLPSSVEAYLQESGRAGRDRQPYRAILLYHPEDREREAENPRAYLRERYEKLLTFAEDSETCRRESLLAILEAEPEDCDSYDVCCGTVIIKDPVEDLVTEIVRKYRKLFTIKLLCDFILGHYSPTLRQGYYYGMISKGQIHMISRGNWKGKIQI
jgi:ATP-dependent DNA helicase RecQ